MSRTVHGTSHGAPTVFCDLPSCITYTACPIWTGEHVGMVQLTITDADYGGCEDTFYGCMDFATGNWEVEIPDGCCANCDTYSSWQSIATYSSGSRVTYNAICYESLEDSNFNNPPSTSPEWWGIISCSCSSGYKSIDSRCGITDVPNSGGAPSRFFCLHFIGLKRCSDNSEIPPFGVCVECTCGGVYPNPCTTYAWTGGCDLGTVFLEVGGVSDLYCSLYGDSGVYFEGTGPYGCPPISNSLIIGNCGATKEIYGIGSDYGGCNHRINGVTIVGYGGYVEIWDPNTGLEWSC